MILLRLSIVFIFFFACNTEPLKEEIEVGNTVKIESSKQTNDSNIEYNYLWSKPNGPIGHNSKYKIDDNKMLFTPDSPGNYIITLLVESENHKLLYEESFYYIATGNKTTKDINKINPSTINDTKNEKIKIKKTSYTLQIASWPTLNQAKKDQIQLNELGFDSYIEEFYIKNKDQTWWRVRVGHFTDKDKAEMFKNKLSQITGNDIWIDFIKE